jgi:hypothetical protein
MEDGTAMNEETLDNLSRLWARAGAMFASTPADVSPNLESLLLDTARHASENPRLLIMAATWLARYGRWVNVEDLASKTRNELELRFKPVMGVLLECAGNLSFGRIDFSKAIAECSPASEAQPLFDIERQNPTLWKLAERSASDISRKWGVWVPNFEPKYNAIRPEEWVASNNPSFRLATR